MTAKTCFRLWKYGMFYRSMSLDGKNIKYEKMTSNKVIILSQTTHPKYSNANFKTNKSTNGGIIDMRKQKSSNLGYRQIVIHIVFIR